MCTVANKYYYLLKSTSACLFVFVSVFVLVMVLCSLASLIRGQVLTSDGTPLVGVNVSFVNNPHYGYTMTRQDGM